MITEIKAVLSSVIEEYWKSFGSSEMGTVAF